MATGEDDEPWPVEPTELGPDPDEAYNVMTGK